jgi:hypothetical protein
MFRNMWLSELFYKIVFDILPLVRMFRNMWLSELFYKIVFDILPLVRFVSQT